MKFLAALAVLALCAGVHGKAWDRSNNPLSWDPSYLLELDKLPTNGSTVNTPWSDTYWPSYQGGIANRWQDSNANYPGFNYQLYTLEELKNGSINLNILSPAEKFDIFNSRYDYPLTKSEWKRTSPSDAMWEGICHGWAPAAYQYQQPNATTLSNKEGLQIPFGSSDVKALLSYFLAQYASEQLSTRFIAQRCNKDVDAKPEMAKDPECWDINPGAFHVVISNMIGIGRSAFVADVDRSFAVWNQPITKYEYTLGPISQPKNDSAPGTVTERSVDLIMYYTKETAPTPTAHRSLILQKRYNYNLHLDANGTILGGSYNSAEADHTDFLWATDPVAFFGYFESLQKIYDASVPRAQRVANRRRVSLGDYKAALVTTGRISLPSYNEHTRHSWFVRADVQPQPLRLHFSSFNTRRFTDYVRVFEVSQDGEIGALVAVAHGWSVPEDIALRPGMSALITFHVDKKATRDMALTEDMGFQLHVY